MYGPNQFDSWKLIKMENEARLQEVRQIRMADEALRAQAARPAHSGSIFTLIDRLFPRRGTPQPVPVRVRVR